MNTKRFVSAFIVVFVLFEITNYIVHGVILASTYQSEGVRAVFRPESDMISNMWIIWLTDIIWSFFFVFFFVKGYENKGVIEGLRYGFYMGIFFSFVVAYQGYAIHPIPYSLAFQWFIYGLIQSLILGYTASLIYKKAEVTASVPSAA